MARPRKDTKDPDTEFMRQVNRYIDHCNFERNFTRTTLGDKRRALLQFARLPQVERLEDLSTQVILDWVRTQKERNLKATTINDRIKHLKSMVNYYLEEDMKIPNLNLRKLHRLAEEPSNKRAFKRDVIYEALKYADREIWLAIKIAFDCGLRIEELRNIKLSDIDGCRISIIGKGRKHRFVIMSEEARSRLDDLIIAKSLTNYVFESDRRKGSPKSQNAIRRKAAKVFAAAGIKEFKMHELRHSYATDLKQLGAPTRLIQQGLGHSMEKTTERYLHDLDDSTLQELYKLKFSVEKIYTR